MFCCQIFRSASFASACFFSNFFGKEMQNTENILHINLYAHYRNECALVSMLIQKCINYENLEYFDRVCDGKKIWLPFWNKYSLIHSHMHAHRPGTAFTFTRHEFHFGLCDSDSQSVCTMFMPFHHISNCWLMICFVCVCVCSLTHARTVAHHIVAEWIFAVANENHGHFVTRLA